MNPVMNDEALAHLEFMTNCLPPLKSFNVESMRERMELTAEKTNKKLSNTFNGTEKETFIPIPSREIEYRLSPEYKYPVWLDDCLEVTKYILKYKTWFDFDGQSSSHKQFIDSQYLITPELRKWFHKNAFRDENDIRDSRVSLLLQSSFNNLPPCLFIVAELDAVRDDSYEYQKLLDKAGVKTQLVLIQGVLHSFFNLP
ncbi:unnamed protein product, partial [Didymodactylos carnosus]